VADPGFDESDITDERLLQSAHEAERYLRFWREANGLDTMRKLAEALPDLFHPSNLHFEERKRQQPDPLAQWENFPGQPEWLDSPTVRKCLCFLWRSALSGKTWPLPILSRFGAAWAFRDREAGQVVSLQGLERDEALLKDRSSLARYLKLSWEKIKHENPTKGSIQTALSAAAQMGRVGCWSLSHNPHTGTPLVRIGIADIDTVAVLASALAMRPVRGSIPWRRAATEALEPLYGRQESYAAPVDRVRAQRRPKKTRGPRR
jgi:hypothetical protein